MRCANDATLWAFAQSELGAATRADVESHIDSCPSCRRGLFRVDLSRAYLRAAAAQTPEVNWRAVDSALKAALTTRAMRRHRLPWPGAFALIGAAAALAVLLWVLVIGSREPELTVEAATGAALIGALTQSAPVGATLEAGGALHVGAIVRTDDGGSAMLRLPDSSRARIGPRSRVMFATASREEADIHLATGALTIEAAHVARKSFVVDAGRVRVHVVGTAFRVERRDAEIAVAVARGRVRVEADGVEPRFVHAGQRLVTRTSGDAFAETQLTGGDQEAFRHLGIAPEKRVASASGEPAPNAESSSSARGVTDRPGIASGVKRKRAPSHKRDAGLPASSALGGAANSAPSSLSLAPQGGHWSAPPVSSPPAPHPPPSLVERARASGLPVTSEGLYVQRAKESLEAGTCPRYLQGLGEVTEWSDDASVREMARVVRARCYDSQGFRVRAQIEYQRYLDEFPAGRYGGEAVRALRH